MPCAGGRAALPCGWLDGVEGHPVGSDPARESGGDARHDLTREVDRVPCQRLRPGEIELAHEIVGSFAGKEKEQGITIMIVFPAQPVEVAQRVHVVRHEPQGWKEAHGTEDESSPPQSPTCTVPESACRFAWARLMAKICKVNPLVCPRCFSKNANSCRNHRPR